LLDLYLLSETGVGMLVSCCSGPDLARIQVEILKFANRILLILLPLSMQPKFSIVCT